METGITVTNESVVLFGMERGSNDWSQGKGWGEPGKVLEWSGVQSYKWSWGRFCGGAQVGSAVELR